MFGYLIHYGEIGLKGENRPFFERKLIENISRAMSDLGLEEKPVKKLYGRLFLETGELANSGNPTLKEPSRGKTRRVSKTRRVEESAGSVNTPIETRLARTPGIANFSPAWLVTRDIDKLKKLVWRETKKRQPFETFRIRATRADKSFPLTSRDVEFQIGGFVKEKSGAKVNLEKADLTCYIEILSKNALFYFEKIPGPGGLPVTTAGKVVTLLSGGIDSPVAAWKMAKRGAKNIFIHFHSYPQTDKASQENVRDLVRVLTKWQLESKLFMVPLLDIQKDIVAKCPKKLRVILYRRMMIRIAEKIAGEGGAKALVTGESLGQVASQTLENINAVNSIATMPILRPLIGMDKQEIVDRAKKIGTYKISIRPYEDCCSLFVPAHPETRADIKEVDEAEKALSIEKLIKNALENTKKEMYQI